MFKASDVAVLTHTACECSLDDASMRLLNDLKIQRDSFKLGFHQIRKSLGPSSSKKKLEHLIIRAPKKHPNSQHPKKGSPSLGDVDITAKEFIDLWAFYEDIAFPRLPFPEEQNGFRRSSGMRFLRFFGVFWPKSRVDEKCIAIDLYEIENGRLYAHV